MVIIAKYLTRNSYIKDEIAFDKCRSFMDDIKGFFAILVAEICPIMIEVCKNILDMTNIDSKIDDMDTIKTIMMQLKRRADASFSMYNLRYACIYYYFFRHSLMKTHCDSQLLPSQPMGDVLIYCKR